MQKFEISKKCKYCKKVLRGWNKSGVCSNCRNWNRDKMKKQKLRNIYKV